MAFIMGVPLRFKASRVLSYSAGIALCGYISANVILERFFRCGASGSPGARGLSGRLLLVAFQFGLEVGDLLRGPVQLQLEHRERGHPLAVVGVLDDPILEALRLRIVDGEGLLSGISQVLVLRAIVVVLNLLLKVGVGLGPGFIDLLGPVQNPKLTLSRMGNPQLIELLLKYDRIHGHI